MSERARLVEGQQVYAVSHRRYEEPRFFTVQKVGRKWATLDGKNWMPRVDAATWKFDTGGYIPSWTLYASKEEYDTIRATRAVWDRFQRAFRGHHLPPPGIGADQIIAAAAALNITLPESDA